MSTERRIAASRKLRPPLKRHGGKAYLARRIIALFPPHRTYCEPFLGGGSVLLNKTPAGREVAGDLDADLIHFWSFLGCQKFQRIIGVTPYSESVFETAVQASRLTDNTDFDRAVFFLVRNRFSRGGLGKDFAWSERLRGKRRPGGVVPGELNSWDTIRESLPAIAERVEHVEFNCCDALQLIRSVDGPETLHYCDPPYLHETRSVRNAYAHEMDRGQHEELLKVLLSCRGKVFLSGYANPLYDEALTEWKRHEWDLPNHSGQGKTKQRRVECLWEKPS